jgi:hypothetical protein
MGEGIIIDLRSDRRGQAMYRNMYKKTVIYGLFALSPYPRTMNESHRIASHSKSKHTTPHHSQSKEHGIVLLKIHRTS